MDQNEVSAEWTGPATLQSFWKDKVFATKYQQDLEDFYDFLVKLNIDIYIVERILAFPVDLFCSSHAEADIFFVRILENFMDQAILTITKLVSDSGTNGTTPVYTLRHFQGQIMKELEDKPKKRLAQALKKIDLKKIDEHLEKAKTIRNKRIAHLTPVLFRSNSTAKTVNAHLLFSEIQAIRDTLNSYYEALTLGAQVFMLPLTYENNTSDLDWMLDCIAKTSVILHMPETDPDRWPFERKRMGEQDLRDFNHYRTKFNLAEV